MGGWLITRGGLSVGGAYSKNLRRATACRPPLDSFLHSHAAAAALLSFSLPAGIPSASAQEKLMAEGANSIANASITKCTLLRCALRCIPRCNCIWYNHSNCKRNRNKNSNGNGDIVLAMGETVLEQGERSKAIYKVQKLPKVKSCPRLPLRPQFC